MKAVHTNEIDLGEEKTEKLLNLLKLAENAETATDAFILPEEDRELCSEIREEIKTQTGR